jgi:hypothetical protein
VREVPAPKVEFSDGVNKRHLLDMDMDDAKPASLSVDWDSVTDVKPDATVKTETVIDVGEVNDRLDGENRFRFSF